MLHKMLLFDAIKKIGGQFLCPAGIADISESDDGSLTRRANNYKNFEYNTYFVWILTLILLSTGFDGGLLFWTYFSGYLDFLPRVELDGTLYPMVCFANIFPIVY